jgi:hypothetical protein
MFFARLRINIPSQWHPRTKPRAWLGLALSQSEVADELGLLRARQPQGWGEITTEAAKVVNLGDRTGQENGVSCPHLPLGFAFG